MAALDNGSDGGSALEDRSTPEAMWGAAEAVRQQLPHLHQPPQHMQGVGQLSALPLRWTSSSGSGRLMAAGARSSLLCEDPHLLPVPYHHELTAEARYGLVDSWQVQSSSSHLQSYQGDSREQLPPPASGRHHFRPSEVGSGGGSICGGSPPPLMDILLSMQHSEEYPGQPEWAFGQYMAPPSEHAAEEEGGHGEGEGECAGPSTEGPHAAFARMQFK